VTSRTAVRTAGLLKSLDDRLGLSEYLALCVRDERQLGKIEHTVHDLIRQRMFGIACGYASCNDAARRAQELIQNQVFYDFKLKQ
jgi:hypothetical protein